jgi:4-amino-4-deoxy-L-arabinose transferase-like glycosyltransferase
LTTERRLSSRTAIGLLVIIAAGLAARLLFCAVVVGIDRPPAGDELDYHHIAVNLSQGDGYRLESGELTARRPPLYPVVLSLLYRGFGVSIALARLLQVLLGTALIPLVFVATRRIFSSGTAWIAAGLTAVNPYLIFISAYVLTENLYALLLVGGVLLAANTPMPAGSWRNAALAGVALGLATLCRPTAWLVALWMAGFGVILGNGSRRRFARGAILVAVLFISLVPWAVRNHAVFDRWEFFTLHGGITFYQGNNAAVLEYPQYHGGVAPLEMLPAWDRIKKMSEAERDDTTTALGREFLAGHAEQVPILVWRKFARFWRFRSDVGLSGIRSGWWFDKDTPLGRLASSFDVGLVYSVAVIPLFVAGFLIGLTNRRRFVLLAGLVVVHTLVALVFFGSLRMRIPIEPVIAMFAADVGRRIVVRLRARRSTL